MGSEIDQEIAEDFDQRGDISQTVCMVAVYTVHYSRMEFGQFHLKRLGVHLSDDELFELAAEWRQRWQVDVPRTVRTRCFLCGSTLPRMEEHLCTCLRQMEVGTVVDPMTPENLKEFIRIEGPEAFAHTYFCLACDKRTGVPAKVVRYNFENGKPFLKDAFKFCQPCFLKSTGKASHPKPARHPSLKGAEAPVTQRVGEKMSLKELQEKLLKDGTPAAES